MKIKSNYTQLNFLLTDIEQQTMRSPAFAFFLQDKIKTLHEQNKFRIGLLRKGMKAIIDKYCKMDEQGNPVIANGNFVYNDDAAKEEFLKEWATFGKEEFELNM